MLRFDLDQVIPHSKELTLVILQYLNLVSEEYYLWIDKHLDQKVWKIWKPEIRRTLNSPLLIREWSRLKKDC